MFRFLLPLLLAVNVDAGSIGIGLMLGLDDTSPLPYLTALAQSLLNVEVSKDGRL